MHLQSAELHMHAGYDPADAHRHGPAVHHHDTVDRPASDTTAVSAPDAGAAVIHVALIAAAAQAIPQLHATAPATVAESPEASTVTAVRIVARAHGPPSVDYHSLRAPPAALSL